MAKKSRNVVQALDRIREKISEPGCGPNYPAFAIGSYEEVLVFNNQETITLKGDPGSEYFSSTGFIYDLCGKKLEGSTVETSVPTAIVPQTLDYLLHWPPEQTPPFDTLPVNEGPYGTIPSYTKGSYDFGDGSSLVTVGAAFPKIAPLKNGGAQFWVSFIGAITQGGGKYKGARGMASFDGSAAFDQN